MPISVIVTTQNEAAALPRLLESLAAQTRPADEIVVADGGSTDATLDVLRAACGRLPLQIISRPGANISQGRNAAIDAAAGEIICSTDAGVRLDANWLAELVRPFEQVAGDRYETGARPGDAIDVVSGFFLPDPRGVFETALAATTLPALADIRPEKFLPSSRSIAFRKTAWERVRGYPEWLDFCEDLIFDFALRAAGMRFAFAPLAVAYFRPRPDLAHFFRQYYHYARGDGKADLWRLRHLVRYATYLIALPFAVALTFWNPWIAAVLWVGAAVAMFYTPYKRLWPMVQGRPALDRLGACAWVPAIRVTGDVAKMLGYPVGVLWRLRRRNAPRYEPAADETAGS